MSQTNIIDDLEYAKNLAEQGVKAPLVGGRFGLLWGCLLGLTFLTQWAILARVLDVPYHFLGWLWLAFAVCGAAGTFLLDRSIRNKPGLASVGNRADSAIWMFFSATMFVCFIGLAGGMALGDSSYRMFDLMVAIGFAGQGMAYGILSRISGHTWLLWPALGAYAAAVLAFFLIGKPALYLVSAMGVVVTIVIPSLINMSREPADVR